METGSATKARMTLIELMIVMVLIVGVMSVVAVNVSRVWEDAKVKTTELTLLSVESSLDYYAIKRGGYPTTQEGLDAARDQMPRGAVPKDGWKRDLLYRAPGETDPHPYDVESYGRDGAAGGSGYDGDIVNWSIDHDGG